MGPITLVGQLAAFIEEFAPTVHLVLFPVPIVVAAILIEELALAMPDTVLLVALVATPGLVFLDNVLDFC